MKSCTYHSFGQCRFKEKCRHSHYSPYRPIEVLRIYYLSTEPNKFIIHSSFYTSDFYHFEKKINGIHIRIFDLKYLHKMKSRNYEVYQYFVDTRKCYYQLLRKYLLICEIIPIADIRAMIMKYQDFGEKLITNIYEYKMTKRSPMWWL